MVAPQEPAQPLHETTLLRGYIRYHAFTATGLICTAVRIEIYMTDTFNDTQTAMNESVCIRMDDVHIFSGFRR